MMCFLVGWGVGLGGSWVEGECDVVYVVVQVGWCWVVVEYMVEMVVVVVVVYFGVDYFE